MAQQSIADRYEQVLWDIEELDAIMSFSSEDDEDFRNALRKQIVELCKERDLLEKELGIDTL